MPKTGRGNGKREIRKVKKGRELSPASRHPVADLGHQCPNPFMTVRQS